jgi:putative PEP-CTERM system TPR-repeat lipoprotein
VAAIVAALLIGGCGSQDPAELRARVDENLAKGSYRAAIIDLRNLIRDNPNDAHLRLLHGQALTGTGDFEAALIELRKGRDLGAASAPLAVAMAEAHLGLGAFEAALKETQDPALEADAPAVFRLRGRALSGLRRDAEAREQLQRALEVDASDLHARLELAQVLNRMEGLEPARTHIDEALKQQPDSIDARMASGSWYAQNRQLDLAHQEFTHALSVAEKSNLARAQAAALVALVEVELMQRRAEAAAASLKKLEKIAGESIPVLMLKARVAVELQKPDEARTALQVLLSRQPDHVQAKLLMGSIEFAEGNLGQAEMYVAAAAAAAPEDRTARRLLNEIRLRQNKARDVINSVQGSDGVDSDLLNAAARASLLLGDLPGAIQYLERSHKEAPGEVRNSLQLAAAYVVGGRAAEALELARSVPVSPETAHTRQIVVLSALAALGKKEEVRREAREFASAHRDDPLALAVAVRGLVAAGDSSVAREVLARFAEDNPKSTAPWLLLGALEANEKKLTAAERAFEEALRRSPNDMEALFGLARVMLARGDRVEAIRTLEKGRAADAKAGAVRLALAQLHLEDGNRIRAEEMFNEAQRLEIENPRLRASLGDLALRLRRAPEAVSIFEQLVKDLPNSAGMHVALARAYVLARRPADAERANAQALKLDPKSWQALALAASMAVDAGNLDRARSHVAELRRLGAPAGLLATLEGDIAIRSGNIAEGARLFAAANAATPTSELAIKEYAALRAANDPDSDLPLRKWLERQPTDTSVRFFLAQELMQKGDSAGAIREYETILTSNPDDVAVMNNLALLKLDAGDTGAALKLASRAYERAKHVPQIADTYGWVLTRTGKPKEALPILQRAYAEWNDPEVRLHLAVALFESGARKEAREHLEALASGDPKAPGYAEARKLLATYE